MKRVLFISPEFSPNIQGGIGIYSYYVVKYLLQVSNEISIDVLCISGKTAIGKNFEELPVKVIKLRRFLPYRLRILEFYIKALFFIYKNRNKYDLLHDNYNLARSLNTPVVYSIHSTMLQEARYYESLNNSYTDTLINKCYYIFLHILESINFKKAAAFIVPSNEIKEHLNNHSRIKKNIFIIQHAVDTDLFTPSDLSLNKKKYNITFIGRHIPRKGLRYFFEALDLLKNRELAIALCGPQLKDAIRHVDKLKGTSRHSFYLKDGVDYFAMPSIYLQSEMVVAPSLYEPFGLVALEAMACATPIVASRVGGFKEILQDQVGGIFVQPNDCEDLAKKISYLLDNAEERIKIGLAGRERVKKEFNWQRCAAQTYKVYTLVLNKV